MEALLERFLWAPVNTESTTTSVSITILAGVWEWGAGTVPVPCWWCTREEEEAELWWVGLDAVTLVWLLLLMELDLDAVDAELPPVLAWCDGCDWVMTLLPTVRMLPQPWLDEGSTGSSSSTNWGVSPIVLGMGPPSPRSSEREREDSFSSIWKCLRFSCKCIVYAWGRKERERCYIDQVKYH